MVKKRGPGRPRKHPLPSPPPSPPPPVAEMNQNRHKDRAGERPAAGRVREGDTVTDAIESVVQGQRRKGQKRKHWERCGEDEDEEEEEDGEVEETEERLPDREENPGNLMARSKTGTGRNWFTQDELQQFHG